jgi:hypothetical protein
MLWKPETAEESNPYWNCAKAMPKEMAKIRFSLQTLKKMLLKEDVNSVIFGRLKRYWDIVKERCQSFYGRGH